MPKSPEPPPPPASAAPPRFSLNNIHIDDAALIFDDRPTGDHHEVTGLAIGVPFVSTLPVYLDSFVEPGLRVAIDGTPFAIQGRTKPFQDSLETVLELRLQALDLTRYLPFVPMRAAVRRRIGAAVAGAGRRLRAPARRRAPADGQGRRRAGEARRQGEAQDGGTAPAVRAASGSR